MVNASWGPDGARSGDGSAPQWGRPGKQRVLPHARWWRWYRSWLPGSDHEDEAMALKDVLERRGPRKLLALDGGGIRGAMTIEVLARIESILRTRTGKPDLVLGDWFDYVGGTSTGAIIATCIGSGMSVDQIRTFYHQQGSAMFQKAFLLKRLWYEYKSEPLATKLREVLGAETTLGSPELRCLLLLVMRNASTDSPWPLSNNPGAKYNDPTRPDCNLLLPLWQLVRASAAAPVFFPPEYVKLGAKEFMFVDGGVTSYNNPAFLLFLMATLAPYKLSWATGPQKLLLVSVGTGNEPATSSEKGGDSPHLLENARTVPSALMSAASMQQDLLCRAFGRCLAGEPLDRELGDLVDMGVAGGPGGGVAGMPELFTYVRYNVELSKDGLAGIGVTDVDPRRVASLDAVDRIPDLQKVGRALAEKRVNASHLDGFA